MLQKAFGDDKIVLVGHVKLIGNLWSIQAAVGYFIKWNIDVSLLYTFFNLDLKLTREKSINLKFGYF